MSAIPLSKYWPDQANGKEKEKGAGGSKASFSKPGPMLDMQSVKLGLPENPNQEEALLHPGACQINVPLTWIVLLYH